MDNRINDALLDDMKTMVKKAPARRLSDLGKDSADLSETINSFTNDCAEMARNAVPVSFSDLFGEDLPEPAWYESAWWAFKRAIRGLVRR